MLPCSWTILLSLLCFSYCCCWPSVVCWAACCYVNWEGTNRHILLSDGSCLIAWPRIYCYCWCCCCCCCCQLVVFGHVGQPGVMGRPLLRGGGSSGSLPDPDFASSPPAGSTSTPPYSPSSESSSTTLLSTLTTSTIRWLYHPCSHFCNGFQYFMNTHVTCHTNKNLR